VGEHRLEALFAMFPQARNHAVVALAHQARATIHVSSDDCRESLLLSSQ